MKHTTKSLWLAQSLLTLALLTGGMLHALTDDELYKHAYTMTWDLSGKTRSAYLAEQNLDEEERKQVRIWMKELIALEKELLSNGNTFFKKIGRRLTFILAASVGTLSTSKLGTTLIRGLLSNTYPRTSVSAVALLNIPLAFAGNSLKQRVLNTKIDSLKQKAIRMLLDYKTASYEGVMSNLKRYDTLRRFVNMWLTGFGFSGIVIPALQAKKHFKI